MADQIVDLQPGKKIGRWRVDKKLGQGGFGAVFQVSDSTGRYALKTEGVNEQIKILKMEVHVLTALHNRRSRHFCRIEDKGRHENFFYMVMTLVGKSIQDLRKAQKTVPPHFSMGTAIGVGIQTLEGIRELHAIGYLHRDVKPGNFTVGRAEMNDLRTVYVLDFGMCRKYVGDSGVLRRPRMMAGFRGTARYAALSCHINREQCRKDDLEAWFYMSIELTMGALPWKELSDLNLIGQYKQSCREEPNLTRLVFGCPPQFREILKIIDGLIYYDEPPYAQIVTMLRQGFISMRCRELPYDWERRGGGIF